MKIVLIGLGQQSQTEIIPAILDNLKIYEVIAICDKDINNINLVASIFPKAKTYTDYKNIINLEKGIDAAIISLPHYLYQDVMKECIKNNLNIFKEKPLSKNFKEADSISRAALKHKIKIYTVTKRNFYQSYIRAKELLPKLGKIYQYTAKHFVTGGNIHEGWKSNFREAGGGVVINLAYHLLDILISYR